LTPERFVGSNNRIICASRTQRRSAETSAQSELAVHISRLEDNDLLQVVAASMRGMGYATVFEAGPGGDSLSSIHAFPRPDAGFQLPAIRVVVHLTGQPRMTAADVARVQGWLAGSGDLGVLVSTTGFADSAAQGLKPDSGHLEMVDLDGLVNIWLTHYERLSEPDRALLPLRPVYFLAGQ
jgi:restriction system protein